MTFFVLIILIYHAWVGTKTKQYSIAVLLLCDLLLQVFVYISFTAVVHALQFAEHTEHHVLKSVWNFHNLGYCGKSCIHAHYANGRILAIDDFNESVQL